VFGWEVKMRKSDPPRFPSICIGCGSEPTTVIKIREDAIGWWSLFRFGWLYGILTGRGIAVPACDPCARRLRRERRLRSLVMWTLLCAGVFLGHWLFGEWTGWALRMAVLGIAVLVASPWIAWEVFFPPAVDITVTEDVVTYQFADESYAERFANENRTL
jgi:hypothetical protein